MNRMQRIKLLQSEKKRKDFIRKTGIVPNDEKYLQCQHCKQQILTSNYKHHIRFCKNAFTKNVKTKCKGCQLFRK